MKLTDLKTADEVLAAALEADPELREEWDRLEVARTIASLVIAYRADHELTQTHLARLLAMHQSAVARLESGEHEPTLPTLLRLARVLDTQFRIEITPRRIAVSAQPGLVGSVA
jgi:DNA-binding XRE family transcriptional regulator